jgi:hypothetical protein
MSGGEKVPKGLKKASKMVSECSDECPKKKASLQKRYQSKNCPVTY